MEAITLAGLIVVLVGGYYTIADFMHDLGIQPTISKRLARKLHDSKRAINMPQSGIKKMARMHI